MSVEIQSEVFTMVELNIYGGLFWLLLILAFLGITVFGENEGYGL